MLEIAPGVFCGRISAKVRDEMWIRIVDLAKDGRALMVFTRRGDQGLDFRVHRHDWEPVDYEGVTLMRRPEQALPQPTMRPGWSSASKRSRARKVK